MSDSLSFEIDRSRAALVSVAVLMAAILTALDLRTSSVGLPDLRGAFGLSFDEGSWLATFATAPQVLVAPCIAWLVVVFGVKRVLIGPVIIYSACCLLIPFIRNFEVLLALHAIRAIMLGVFVGATIMTAFRNLDRKYWIVALAFYVVRIPFAQNLGLYTAGSYSQSIGWQWLYWQDALVAPAIGLLVWVGAKSVKIDVSLFERTDWGGMAILGVALTVLFVALDQGNRLDWFRSGFIMSMLIGSAFLVVVFLLHEHFVREPWAYLWIFTRNVALGFLAVVSFMVANLSSSLLAPNFLIAVAHLRPEQIGNFSAPYAILLLIFATTGAVILVRTVGPRVTLIIGFSCFALSSWLGTFLTSLSSLPEFDLIVILQTVAEEITFLAAVTTIFTNANPAQATTFAAYVQVMRLIGPETAATVMATWIRQREQLHSYLIGLHVTDGTLHLDTASRDLVSIATAVQKEANVQAYIDGFWITFYAAIIGLIVVSLMAPSPQHPLTHPR